MTIRGILFDKDGTLIDFPATWEPVLRALALEFATDKVPADQLMAVAGYDHDQGLFRPGSVWAAGNTLDLVDAWFPDAPDGERLRTAHWIDDYCQTIAPDTAKPVTDLVALLDGLRQAGYSLGVATNDVARSARATLQRLGVADRLSAILGYDSVAQPKPAADMVLAFCAAAAMEPREVAVVGDNLHDIIMARAAGAGLAIGVLSGNGTREQLSAHADHVIATIDDLPRLLHSLNAHPSPAPAN